MTKTRGLGKEKPCRLCATYIPIPMLGTGRAYGLCPECVERLDAILIGRSIERMAGARGG